MARLKTSPISSRNQLVAHFDESAAGYEEAHGDARRLLDYRLALIRQQCEGRSGVLLEIGCGTAIHLLSLAPAFSRLVGTDISAGMIEAARRKLQTSAYRDRIELRVDPAEELNTVNDASVDVVLCVGAFEHMLDKGQVVGQVSRVLKRGGAFVLLTPNGGFCWYSFLAPLMGISTRHLSTDYFVHSMEVAHLLQTADLCLVVRDFWTFIPKGDMPGWTGATLEALDRLGRICRLGMFRGGLLLTAVKSA